MSIEQLKGHQKEYDTRGYTIYPKHIDLTTCQKLKDSCFEDLTNLIFRNYSDEKRPDLREKDNWPILTSSFYRKENGFIDEDVWNGGNSRKPHWSKNNGMFNVYYNRDCHRYIHFNPDTFLKVASLYGHNKIRLTRGMERLCIKLGEIKIKDKEGKNIRYPGSTDMPTHLDYHLFNDEINMDRERVQAFVCIEVDDEIDPRNSGGLQVIPYFHLYWDIAKRYFREDGKHPLSVEEYKVFTPQPWGKQFNKELPKFNEFLKKLHGTISATSKEEAEYKDLLHTLPAEYRELKWTPLAIKKGDLVCWDQRLPHSSLRNKSSIPRIVSYVTFMPSPSKSLGYDYEWEGSEQQKNLIEAIKSGKDGFHQGTNRDNKLEIKYLRDGDFEYWYKPREQPDSKLFKHDNLELYQKFCDYLQGL